MNKWSLRNYFRGFFSALLLLAFVVPVIAVNNTQQISATYNGVEIYVEGQKLNPKDANGNIVIPFVVDGTTYLPLRAVAEAVGYDVNYNATSLSIILTAKTDKVTQSPAPTPTPTPTPIDTSLQSNLVSRLDVCIKTANVAYNNLQTKINGYISRGMARSSSAQSCYAAQASISSDVSNMQSLQSSIRSASDNEQLTQYQSQVDYYESVY